MAGLFKRRNLEEYADSLAAYMPGGELFTAKSVQNTNFRKLLRGMAGELFRANGLLRGYSEEILPDQTTRFLDEWEAAVGIPDECFLGGGTNDERRCNILVKLAALGVQTPEDFEELALTLGVVVTVTSLAADPFPPYDVPFTPIGLPGGRFVIVVEGENLVTEELPPYDVPFSLVVGESLLECIFNRLKPANCSVLFRNTN